MKAVLFAVLACVLTATSVAAQDGYRIRTGDQLNVEVLEDPSLNRQLLVTPGGTISFPFAGALRAEGQTTDQIGATLSRAISSNFAAPPNVFVSVTGLGSSGTDGAATGVATITVYFLGEVASPGAREIERGTTFLQGLSLSGGLTNFAADRRIQLRRTDRRSHTETVATINFRALQDGGRLSDNLVLSDGDVILVPQRRLFE